MEGDPRKNDQRREARRRMFGPNPACMLCGETDPVVFHHTAGHNNDAGLEGPYCLNCHAKAHEALRDASVPIKRGACPTVPERVEAILKAVATYLGLLADSLMRWAGRLRELIDRMDDVVPDWREWGVVQP